MRPELERLSPPEEISWYFRIRRETSFEVLWHFHPEIELTLITEGSGTRIVGDSIENYAPGDLTLIGSGLPHTYASSPDSEVHEAVVVQFRDDFLGPEFLGRPEFSMIKDLVTTAALGVNLVAGEGLTSSVRSLGIGSPATRTLALLRLLATVADEPGIRTLTTTATPQPMRSGAKDRVDAVYAHVAANYTRPVHLAEVAKAAHLTPPAFSRFFRRRFGRTLTDYVNELRIAAACRLLSESDLPIAEIAARSGFQNLSNFNRRFRRLKGIAPRQYRQRSAERRRT